MSWHGSGVLTPPEPLYAFLVDAITRSSLGPPDDAYEFRVNDIQGDGTIVKYSDVRSTVTLVVKYYGRKWINGRQSGDRELRAELMAQEYDNLETVRGLGLTDPPHGVVRPLAMSEAHDCALVLEYVPGEDLDVRIRRSVEHGATEELFAGVIAVGRFLADLHGRSAKEPLADCGARGTDYVAAVTNELVRWEIVNSAEAKEFVDVAARWRDSGRLCPPRSALIHGDATPKHFRFTANDQLTVIDFERLRRTDPASDLGRMAAELKHLFFFYAGDRWASEPYIEALYRSYSERAGEHGEDFFALTERAQFYMGCDELRICRNHWLDMHYRHRLIQEARACLATP